MDELFKHWTSLLAIGIEAAAALIIGIAALQSFINVLPLCFKKDSDDTLQIKQNIRLRLGRWLGLALEFEVAADILRTAVSPSWDELGKLGAIVVLRTVLNFFLQREIDEAAERRRAEHA
jgi:uncharacterized membrane protein